MLQRTAKSCGPDASTLASSLAEARSAQPGWTKPSIRKATVAKEPDRRGATVRVEEDTGSVPRSPPGSKGLRARTGSDPATGGWSEPPVPTFWQILRTQEHEGNRKTIARGMPGDSGVLVVTRVRSTNTKCTRGRGCNGHPAFPAPSDPEGGKFRAKLAQHVRRDRVVVFANNVV